MAHKPVSVDYDQHVREQEGIMKDMMVTRGVTCSWGLHHGITGQANPMVFECGHCICTLTISLLRHVSSLSIIL